MSPAGTLCFDIFSLPPGNSDVISQVERLSSNETKIAPSTRRFGLISYNLHGLLQSWFFATSLCQSAGRYPPPHGIFVVTNLKLRNARVLYEDVYCRRGQAENHIKSWKTHLAADRTSCTKATANQFRLFLHAGAYWLMWGLRASMPKRSMWRVAQFDTLRLRLIKVAARVVEMKTMIKVHLPTSCPAQDILRLVLGRIPRLVT